MKVFILFIMLFCTLRFVACRRSSWTVQKQSERGRDRYTCKQHHEHSNVRNIKR